MTSLPRLVEDVFMLDEKLYGEKDPLPGIYVTEPVECTDGLGLREIVLHYPSDVPEEDLAYVAAEYAFQYYREGMRYSQPQDKQKRIDCFRAAEILHRHAVERGWTDSALGLGYIYSYDRCEGQYYKHTPDEPFSIDERAYEAYRMAADAGDAEGCYKLGDLLKRGKGCEQDEALAFEYYTRAFELGKNDEPYRWGSIALRIADAYANGMGCSQDFAKALEWYEKAVMGLEIAVNSGDTYYRKVLANAKAAAQRMKQEVAGTY